MIDHRYRERLSTIIEKIFREDWMDDNDFNQFLTIAVDHMGGWDKLDKEVEMGVANGYSVDNQLELIEKLFINKHGAEP